MRLRAEAVDAFKSGATLPAVETSRPGDEDALAKRAIAKGATVIVVVGGDGTCGRVANAILRSQSECALAVVPCGTGNDFAKTLGVQVLAPRQVADLVTRNASTKIDVGLADDHYFLNSCGFGFDASVLEASQSVRFLKGDAIYIYSALKQLFFFRGIEVAASSSRHETPETMLMLTVSNGRFLGGVFKIAPDASVLDGKLDACFIGNATSLMRMKLFLGAMRGTHLGMPSVATVSVEELSLTFASSPWMELDGELRRARSSTVELKCVTSALSVIAAPGALV